MLYNWIPEIDNFEGKVNIFIRPREVNIRMNNDLNFVKGEKIMLAVFFLILKLWKLKKSVRLLIIDISKLEFVTLRRL